MATQKEYHNTDAQNERIKELTEENELLLEQLHMVQEELERYYLKLKEVKLQGGTAVASDYVDPRLPELLAQNQLLQAMVDLQKNAMRIEAQNSLESRLGAMLITGVSSKANLLALPGKLRKMWKAVEATTPPSALGDKSFQKVIDAHNTDGTEAVEKLLDSVFISPAMRADAYTALARHLMPLDVWKATENARLAYETDPRPYRLKWLTFRVHDTDDAITAEAMLDMLPADITMSESEERQAARIRNESALRRKQDAEKKTSFAEHRKAEQAKVARLTKEAETRKQEADALRVRQAELEALADKRKQEVDALRVRQAELEVYLPQKLVAFQSRISENIEAGDFAMKKSHFTDSQIVAILKQAENGIPVPELCREYGMSSASFYKWRARFGGMDISMIARMKALEKENSHLKRMYADAQLRHEILQEVLENEW